MKNQKGVTLIALVVTIIVLIILAGVAIAALTGENGLIRRSREAKKLQIEGEVSDRIVLAIAASKVLAENEATKSDTGYLASKDLVNGKIKTEIEKDLDTTYYTYEGVNETSSAPGTITITYKSDEYDNAVNKDNSQIVHVYNVRGNNFELKSVTPEPKVED